MDDVAVGVAQDLDLDVAAPTQVALQEHGVVAETAHGLPPGGSHRGRQVRRVRHQTHPLAAASRGRLDHERETDVARVAGILRRRQRGHARGLGCGLGRQLVAHGLDGIGSGADPHQAGRGHGPGEAGVLGQEAVAGMHGVGAGLDRGGHHRGAVEVSAGQPHSHIGLGHERRLGVGVGEHGHAAHAHGPGRAEHPAGDLTPVGHQQRADGAQSQLRPELAATNAENGAQRCQFPTPQHARPELAATNAQNGAQRCQFPNGALTAGTPRSPRRR